MLHTSSQPAKDISKISVHMNAWQHTNNSSLGLKHMDYVTMYRFVMAEMQWRVQWKNKLYNTATSAEYNTQTPSFAHNVTNHLQAELWNLKSSKEHIKHFNVTYQWQQSTQKKLTKIHKFIGCVTCCDYRHQNFWFWVQPLSVPTSPHHLYPTHSFPPSRAP